MLWRLENNLPKLYESHHDDLHPHSACAGHAGDDLVFDHAKRLEPQHRMRRVGEGDRSRGNSVFVMSGREDIEPLSFSVTLGPSRSSRSFDRGGIGLAENPYGSQGAVGLRR